MRQHWADEHPGIEIDEQTLDEIKLGLHEIAWTSQFTQLLTKKNVKK
jgi:hypothetical protein